MDEDPSNEVFMLYLLEGYGADEAKAMETEPTPRTKDWRANTSPGWIEWNFPQIGPRPGTSLGWPSRSPSSTSSCTSAPRLTSCSGASPSPGP
jgi:hypothetical protein